MSHPICSHDCGWLRCFMLSCTLTYLYFSQYPWLHLLFCVLRFHYFGDPLAPPLHLSYDKNSNLSVTCYDPVSAKLISTGFRICALCSLIANVSMLSLMVNMVNVIYCSTAVRRVFTWFLSLELDLMFLKEPLGSSKIDWHLFFRQSDALYLFMLSLNMISTRAFPICCATMRKMLKVFYASTSLCQIDLFWLHVFQNICVRDQDRKNKEQPLVVHWMLERRLTCMFHIQGVLECTSLRFMNSKSVANGAL